jgi:hypothetical protein
MNSLKSIIVAVLALVSLGLAGCVFIESSTVSSSAAKGSSVSASASDWGILHLDIPDGLTSNVNGQLMSQCASAKLSNVATELQMREFFLAQMYTVSATADCE